MRGFICKEGEYEWWIRRKEKRSSDIVISRECERRITRYELDYVISDYCECPRSVKAVARAMKSFLR